MKYTLEDSHLTIFPEGEIHSANAAEKGAELEAIRTRYPGADITLDISGLRYISSAGLRVILRLFKSTKGLRLVNASPEVYEVFDLSGFTELMEIRKALREVSVAGCEVIGEGANGKVFRISPDTAVKVYTDANSLPDIDRERRLARTAFVHGIPTAIPYDVVRIREGGYGSVFELLNAESLAGQIARGEKSTEEAAAESIALLKQIHQERLPQGTLPSAKESYRRYLSHLKEVLSEELLRKLEERLEAVPESLCLLHGDYHINNILEQNGELLLIDMDTICQGDPVFELAGMYSAYCGFVEFDHDASRSFFGIPYEQGVRLWKESLRLYLEGRDEESIRETERNAMAFSYVRVLSHYVRKHREEELVKGYTARLKTLL